MSYRPLFSISFLFFCLSILNPVHTQPWAGFFSEFFCFVAFWMLLPIFLNKKIKIPIILTPLLLISFIPLVQFNLGQVFFFSNSFFSSIYLFCFWLAIVVGFNFSLKNRSILDIRNFLSIFFILVGFASSVFAIMQWLGLSNNSTFIMSLSGSRPYANMAQPNHLATFLCMGIFSCWYLFEKNKLNKYVLIGICIFFIFIISLTQSRTAWMILIIAIFFLIFSIRKFECRLSYKFLFFLVFIFIIFSFSTPYLNKFLSLYFNVVQANGIIGRALEVNGRLVIWDQMLHAIIQKPWFGYGWNQTTSAQYNVIEYIHGHEWVTSSHNLILDILVWCGIPLGLFVIFYLFFLYVNMLVNIKKSDDIFCILIVSAVAMHSLLEFPIYYSYFFIPIGLLVGDLLKEEKNDCFLVKPAILCLIFIFGIGAMVGVFRDYLRINDNLFAGKLHAMGNLRAEVELPYHLCFFDFFDARARWLALYPEKIVSKRQLVDAQKMVKTYLKPYDLYKYAQLLAFNGYKKDALQQLKILKILYGMDISYESLFDEKEFLSINHPSSSQVK